MPQLQDISVDWVSLVDRAAVRDPQNKSEPRRFLLSKREGADAPENTIRKDGTMPDEKTPEELNAALTKAEEDAAKLQKDHEAALAKKDEERKAAVKKAEEERDAAIAKADPKTPPVKGGSDKDGDDEPELSKAAQARLAKAEEQRVALEKRVGDAEKIAKEERDRRVTAEYIAKAEGFGSLTIDPPKFGPVLKRAAEKLDKEDYEAIEQLLTATNEQVAKGELFKQFGSDPGGRAVPEGAYAEVQQKAEELRKSDTKLSKGEAEARIMRENPDLQARYLAEMRG